MRYDSFAVQPEVAMTARGIVDSLELLSCHFLRSGALPLLPRKKRGSIHPKVFTKGNCFRDYGVCFVSEKKRGFVGRYLVITAPNI